jgi:hypothetical protein
MENIDQMSIRESIAGINGIERQILGCYRGIQYIGTGNGVIDNLG